MDAILYLLKRSYMDVLTLARFQFALTIMFHYIFPVLSIGLGIVMVIVEGIYLKTRDPAYLRMAQFWTKIFALTFAMGVATGIVMEFEFGTNWSTYSRYVGDVFGSALASEGIFAFFLESGFLAILLFGWNRVGPKTHFLSTLLVCLGAHFSAIWIVVANSWMQTPAGFHIVGEGLQARAEITSFWEMVLNPSSAIRLAHVIVGCWLAGAFLVASIAAYYMLKKRHEHFARSSMKIGLGIALVACLLQVVLGDLSARVVAKYQPAKLAAMEGLYETEAGAGLSLFGVVNPKEEKLEYSLVIPKLLSYLLYGDSKAEVAGLDQVPREEWPNVSAVFMSYHLMLMVWGIMLFLAIVGIYFIWKGKLETQAWFLRALVISEILPQIGNQAGWVAAEMGRYPWIVYGQLRIAEGLSKAVTANQIVGSILISSSSICFFLFYLFIS
jgi:cytochrome bd ubiquinol oxidase subunit I